MYFTYSEQLFSILGIYVSPPKILGEGIQGKNFQYHTHTPQYISCVRNKYVEAFVRKSILSRYSVRRKVGRR